MSMTNIEAKKQNGCVLHWNGEIAVSGAYDDDGNKRGFLILPDGVTVTPNGTFAAQKMKDGRNVWKFDGSTNYISLTDNTAWHIWAGDTTIACWINVTALSTTYPLVYQVVDANNRWMVWLNDTNQLNIRFVSSGSHLGYYLTPNNTITSTGWHYVVFIRSGSTSLIYLNGTSISLTALQAWTGTPPNLAAPLEIGRYSITSIYSPGNIKDLMIFKKALTPDQIAAIYKETYIY